MDRAVKEEGEGRSQVACARRKHTSRPAVFGSMNDANDKLLLESF
jgi:hypothetical protein